MIFFFFSSFSHLKEGKKMATMKARYQDLKSLEHDLNKSESYGSFVLNL